MSTDFIARLLKREKLSYKVYFLRFELVRPKEISFLAGQYVIINIKQAGRQKVRRFISIASPPTQRRYFEAVMKMIDGGIASEYLMRLKSGEEVVFEGPAGKFTLQQNERGKIFLATGTGIAPIRSMLYQLQVVKKINAKNYLFWGLPTLKEVYFLEEFKRLAAKDKSFNFFICLSQEKSLLGLEKEVRKNFFLGRVNQAWETVVKKESFGDFDYYLCGDREVVESLNHLLLKKRIRDENIYFEKFV